jgi:hypothetical protein
LASVELMDVSFGSGGIPLMIAVSFKRNVLTPVSTNHPAINPQTEMNITHKSF